jgi:hypothetical protein
MLAEQCESPSKTLSPPNQTIVSTDEAGLMARPYRKTSRKRSGPGNLNKPISGGSATFDGPTGR